MEKTLILFVCCFAVTLAQLPRVTIGPDRPYGNFDATDCSEAGLKVVDESNMCWFHECVVDADEVSMRTVPKRCALGSKVSYNFVSGVHNPCTINFNAVSGYDCTRRADSVNGPPPCFINRDITCVNGGILVYEANLCWCQCPETWQGDFDCSKPTRTPDPDFLAGFEPICIGGEPLDDFCSQVGGCLNGGICANQCNSFWCDCPDHENNNYWGKRCEQPPN